MTDPLSHRKRPGPDAHAIPSLVIHEHFGAENIGWILSNGRYLSNGEVEAMERRLGAAQKVIREEFDDSQGVQHAQNIVKDYERCTTAEEYYEVLVNRIKAALGEAS